jgi:hypothetical protein
MTLFHNAVAVGEGYRRRLHREIRQPLGAIAECEPATSTSVRAVPQSPCLS